MTMSPLLTGTPVVCIWTMRSIPPTGGVTSVMVRPARSSPFACTVTFSGPFVTNAVGTVFPRSGRRGTAKTIAAPTASTADGDGGPNESTPRHSDLLIISVDGRLVAMRSPGSMPDATTACSLPRFEICTRRSWNSDPSSS